MLAGAGRVLFAMWMIRALNLRAAWAQLARSTPTTANPSLDIQQLTSGRGADIALECVGTPATVKLAIDAVRKGATVTLVGNVTPTVEIGLQSIVTRQIRLQGSCASSGEYPACISLISRGAIRVEPLLSAVAPLEEGAEWFRRLYAREPGLMKVVLQP